MLRRITDIVFLRYVAASAMALGVDLGLYLPYGIGFYGNAAHNLETDGWGEQSYELRFKLAGIDFRPYYQQFRYEDQFGTGVNGAYPFSFLATLSRPRSASWSVGSSLNARS